jgi:hypothetical protein
MPAHRTKSSGDFQRGGGVPIFQPDIIILD